MENTANPHISDTGHTAPVVVPPEVAQAGVQAHQDSQEAEKLSQELRRDAEVNAPVVPPQQFENAPKAPAKKTVFGSLLDLLTFKWYKTSMRNRYGEDINKVREVRENQRAQHAAKPQKETYRAPGSPVAQSAAPPTPQVVMSPPVENVQSMDVTATQPTTPATDQGVAAPRETAPGT